MSSDNIDPDQMPMDDNRDIAPILESWTLEPETVSARRIAGNDGGEMLQLRIPMGLLQLYPDGRPDGSRPEGHDSLLSYLRDLAERQNQSISREQWLELDREIMQYYHRRIALLSIAEIERREQALERAAADYARVVRDADHNIEVMDFIKKHNQDQEFVEAHEQYRTFVMGHRTLGAGQYWLCRNETEEALVAIQSGLDRLGRLYEDRGDADIMRRDPTAGRLVRLAEQIRRDHSIARTLHEELSEAVAAEDFEKAAQVRDRIRQRMAAMKAPFKP
jgi:hypothetical protein